MPDAVFVAVAILLAVLVLFFSVTAGLGGGLLVGVCAFFGLGLACLGCLVAMSGL